MTPMFTLFLGILAFIGLIATGFIEEWSFGAGLLVMVVGCLGVLGWSLWYAFGDVKPAKDTTP